MKTLPMILAVLLMATDLFADTPVEGIIDAQVWGPGGSPYVMVGDLIITNLEILPGVTVLADGDFEIEVIGLLVAHGTEQDPIHFSQTGNTSNWQGFYFNSTTFPSSLKYCEIEQAVNSAVRIVNSTPEIQYCTLRDNTGSTGGGIKIANTTIVGSEINLEGCKFINNVCSTNGGALHVSLEAGHLILDNTLFENNIANPDISNGSYGGGALYLTKGEVFVSNSVFTGNECYSKCTDSFTCGVTARGGAIFLEGGENATISNSIFRLNRTHAFNNGDSVPYGTTASVGAAVFVRDGGNLTVINSIMAHNSIVYSGGNYILGGGGVFAFESTATIINCTVAENTNSTGLESLSSTMNVMNSILYLNNDAGNQVGGAPTITYSNVQNGYGGEGNISGNPLFVDDLYHVSSISTCVDGGNPDPGFNDVCFPPSQGGGRNDMGAYGGPGACGGDGPATDTDEDGLSDEWEISGIPYSNGAGVYFLPGADPNHKDLFVEVDAQDGEAPPTSVLQAVVDAFANAPVDNPDNTTGIRLHIVGQTGEPSVDDEVGDSEGWDIKDANGNTNFSGDFDTYKLEYFGTELERNSPDSFQILEAKEKAFRYCVFIYAIDDASGNQTSNSGAARSNENDFVVSLKNWLEFDAVDSITEQMYSGTFMHELGHTLGLHHGGSSSTENGRIGYKPNYYSVMNYTWMMPYNTRDHCANDETIKEIRYHNSWRLDYSREQLPLLNENFLNEVDGLGGQLGVWVPIGPSDGNSTFVDIVDMALPIDWNRNEDGLDVGVQADANYLPNCSAQKEDSPGEVLVGHNDWANLNLAVPASTTSKSHLNVEPLLEVTFEIAVGLATVEVDCNGNGIEDGEEIAGDPALDKDGDGVLDVCQEAGSGLPTSPGERFFITRLGNAVPNPFNPQTTIAFELPKLDSVSLRVFDLSGRLVRNLIAAQPHTPGRHEAVWNGRDEAGRQVASGTYFYRLEAGSFSETKRMVLVK